MKQVHYPALPDHVLNVFHANFFIVSHETQQLDGNPDVEYELSMLQDFSDDDGDDDEDNK